MQIIKSSELKKTYFDYIQLEKIKNVNKILNDVRNKGDSAIIKYTKAYDKINLNTIEITKKEIRNAYRKTSKNDIKIIRYAAKNIEFFAKKQLGNFYNFETKNKGVLLGQRIIPLKRVGCYVPGGRYPLPSSALMTVIPAKVAGVREIIVCSPKIAPITIVAADIAGANRIFNVGGIQAIGAMAYGTETIPKVDKIVGPGNKYVMAAKKEVFGAVGIDFMAGPSEVMIIADKSADAEYIAADLLAQAEHDPNARCDLLTDSAILAKEVNKELTKQIKDIKTGDIAEYALKNGKIVIVNTLQEAAEISNKRAPEHLEIQVKKMDSMIRNLNNYGSLFIGKYSAEAYGDYCTGTNHTLPTNGAANYAGGLSVKDFLKILTYQKLDKKGCSRMERIASRMAEIEGLDAHRKASEIRLKKEN